MRLSLKILLLNKDPDDLKSRTIGSGFMVGLDLRAYV